RLMFLIILFLSVIVVVGLYYFHSNKSKECANTIFNELLCSLPYGVLALDKSGKIVFYNQLFMEMFGIGSGYINDTALLPEAIVKKLNSLEGSEPIEISIDNKKRYLFVNKSEVKLGNFLDGYLFTFWDITEQELLKDKYKLAYEIFKNSLSAIAITDLKGNIIDINDSFEKITGYTKDEVLGRNISILKSGIHDKDFYANMWSSIKETGKWEGEIWNKKKNNDIYPEYLSIFALYDNEGNQKNYVANFADISDIKRYEERLESLAYYNEITKLPNKKFFISKLKKFIVDYRDKSIAICYLDIDNFRKFMDKHGTEISNNVIYQISNRILPHLRTYDIISHFDDDIFVFVTIYDNQKSFEEYLEKIQWAIYRTITINGEPYNFTSSIGVTIYPEDNDTVDELIRHAQQALYNAKLKGKNKISYYDIIMSKQIAIRKEKYQAIEEGLKNSEFVLFLQPKYNIVKNCIVGAEILVRWQHPKVGLIPPGEFIPYIYNTDLEVEFDKYIFDKAIEAVKYLKNNGIEIKLAINISPKALLDDNLVDYVNSRLSNFDSDIKSLLEIEIIESTSIDNLEKANSILNRFHHLGFGIAVDDFGTGYASLDYIKSLPIDTVKIDRVFVSDMINDPTDLNITEIVILLAKAFNKEIVAEGVESLETASALIKLGCEIFQGYLISKPLPIDDFVNYAKYHQGIKMKLNIENYFNSKDDIEIYAAINSFRRLVEMIKEIGSAKFDQNKYDKIYFNSISWLRNKGMAYFDNKSLYKSIVDKMVKMKEIIDKMNKRDIPQDMYSLYLEELIYTSDLLETLFK
ncbi:MAG: EAL domain-containing protein, partial [Deferribacterales bacterium]